MAPATRMLPSRRRRGAAAFTLVEILVTMALLSFIVLGLLTMFNQTQRAFRSGLGQTDVLEGGRGAMDMLVRDVEQLTPSQAPAVGKPIAWFAMNYWSGADPHYPNFRQYLPTPNGPGWRTNVVDQFFLLTRLNQDWLPVFYRVEPAANGSAVGSLYRYSTTWPRYAAPGVGHMLLRLNNFPSPPYWFTNRVVDGVVHLQVRAFDTNGVPLVPFNGQSLASSWNLYRPSVTNASGGSYFQAYSPCDVCFWSNAVPAYVELEMGILEAKTLQHYLAIDPTTPAAQAYLSNHVGQVHLFRQRIPIRNVDFSAYQ
jgi:type II secretory pathway pseudopilin PulG